MMRTPFMAFAAAIALAGALFAQAPRWSVGATAGVGFKAPPPATSSWLAGAGFSFWPSEHFGAGVDVAATFLSGRFCGSCILGSTLPNPPLITDHVLAVAFTARARLSPHRTLDPYLLLGAGFAHDSFLQYTGLQVVGGGGVAIRLGQSWQLRPELRLAHQPGGFVAGLSRVAVTLARTF